MQLTTQKSRLVATLWQLWATIRIELLMQWRRWGFWFAFIAVFGFCLWYVFQLMPTDPNPIEQADYLMFIVTHFTILTFGIVVAILMSDRLQRDQQLGMSHLQRTTPLAMGIYLLGKFIGNYIAVVVPIFVSIMLLGGALVLQGNPSILLFALVQSFVFVCLPSCALLLGLTLFLSSLLPLRIVQLSMSLFWIYVNVNPPGLPAINQTIFNLNGLWIMGLFFPPSPMEPTPSLQLAVLNISILFITTIILFLLTYTSLEFRHRKEGIQSNARI